MPQSEISVSESDVRGLIIRAGFILRNLRNSLRELGFDETLAQVADGIPNARARLGFVVTMTENAASDVLNSVELTQPCQSRLEEGADLLRERWITWLSHPEDTAGTVLAEDTRAWLGSVPQLTAFTRQQLQAVMMAQGFQDLTGQVIQRMTKVLDELEKHLVQVLRDNVAAPDAVRTASQPATTHASDAAPASQPARTMWMIYSPVWDSD